MEQQDGTAKPPKAPPGKRILPKDLRVRDFAMELQKRRAKCVAVRCIGICCSDCGEQHDLEGMKRAKGINRLLPNCLPLMCRSRA